MKNKPLSAVELNEYLWEALQDYRAGKITTNELKALTNTAGKMIQISLLDIMSKNSLGNNPKLSLESK